MNLTKTILILFSIIFYAACSLFAQDKVIDEKLYEKENGKWFLHENNRKFKVLPRTQAPARACLTSAFLEQHDRVLLNSCFS